MPEHRFPEAFLEIGKDEDHSYMSLRTTRLPDGRLQIDHEGWGISEHGIIPTFHVAEKVTMRFIGRCGSVFSETWDKVSLSHVLEKEQEDKARQIEYSGWAPVKVGQIEIRLRLFKVTS